MSARNENFKYEGSTSGPALVAVRENGYGGGGEYFFKGREHGSLMVAALGDKIPHLVVTFTTYHLLID